MSHVNSESCEDVHVAHASSRKIISDSSFRYFCSPKKGWFFIEKNKPKQRQKLEDHFL